VLKAILSYIQKS